MLRRVLKRANRMGFAFHGYDLNKLNETSQDKLFRHCRSEQRCLRHLLSSNPDRLVPCILDNVGTTLSYQISNMILINATLLLVHCFIMSKFYAFIVPSVLYRCWLGGRKGIRPVNNRVVGYWRGCLSGARCRLAYGPADATATHASCFSKIQIGFTFLVPAHPSSPGQRAVKWVCVCVCVRACVCVILTVFHW